MRHLTALILGMNTILIHGCAKTSTTTIPPERTPAIETAVPTTIASLYSPRAAAALAFDPAFALQQPLASFSREGRSPTAFVGYEQQQTEFLLVRQKDQQIDQDRTGLDRRAYTTRSSVTTR